MRKRLLLPAAVVLVAVLVTAVLLGRGPASPEPAVQTSTASAATQTADARLAGRRGNSDPRTPREDPAPWIAALGADDADAVAEGAAYLRERLKAGGLTPAELLSIAVLPADGGLRDRIRQLALQGLAALGRDAVPLLPRLLDLLEGGSPHARQVAAGVALTLAGSEGSFFLMAAIPDDPELRPQPSDLLAFLPRIQALVADEGADQEVRLAMLPLLAAMGGEAASAAPALIAWIEEVERSREEFRRSNPMVHVSWHHYEFTIAETLSALGAPALPAILEGLRREDGHGEYALEMAIRDMGPEANDALRALLGDGDADVRVAALVALAANTEGEPATFALLQDALRDPSPDVRAAAVGALRKYGAEAGPDLVAALADADDDVREAAARALGAVPEAAASALPTLLEMMKSGSYGEQLSTLGTLEKLGPAAADATPAVLGLLADAFGSGMRRDLFFDSFVQTLQAFGEAAVPYLVEAASGDDDKRRRAAAAALLAVEGVHSEDLAPLADLLPTLARAERMRLAAVLAAHDHPAATRMLVSGLSAEARATRTAAAEGLQHAGPDAIDALSRLVEGLRTNHARLHADGANWNEEWEPYYAFSLAVSHVGSHAPSELLPFLADENEDVAEAASRGVAQAGERGLAAMDAHWSSIPSPGRVQVIGSLAHLAYGKEPSPGAHDRLVAALEDSDARVRYTAARVVRGEGLRPRVVAVFIALLSEPEEKIVQDAAYRLRGMGAELAPWEAELRAAQPKQESTARRWIQDALDAIEDAR